MPATRPTGAPPAKRRTGRLRLRLAAAVLAALCLFHILPAGAQPAEPATPAGSTGTDPKAAKTPRPLLLVGPGRSLKTPSAAAAVAKNGDHVQIDAGEYRDCAIWPQNGLFLEGVGGRPHIRDATCADQAIWLIRGSNVTVANLEFSGARVTARNGAGIKFTGSNLTVRNSEFHHNENGILTGSGPRSTVRIQGSTFRYNGKCEPDCAHGIYIGRVAQLIVANSTFQYQTVGHHIKSRALASLITGNRIEDGLEGTASFAIDLPNGGTAVIRDNYIQKGPKATNRLAVIAIGEEGAPNPSRGIDIFQNSFLSSHPALDSFIWNRSPNAPVTVRHNRFTGKAGSKLKGPGRVQD